MFSDWLEENGEEDRSEFIRLQIEIAQTIADCGCANCVRDRNGGHFHNGPCSFGESFKRERSWIATNRKALREQYGFDAGLRRQGPIGDGFMEGLFDRGFIGSIRLTAEQFEQHAAELFRDHPITEVVLSDRDSRNGGNYDIGWVREHDSSEEDRTDTIHPGIYECLEIEVEEMVQTNNEYYRWKRFSSDESALARTLPRVRAIRAKTRGTERGVRRRNSMKDKIVGARNATPEQASAWRPHGFQCLSDYGGSWVRQCDEQGWSKPDHTIGNWQVNWPMVPIFPTQAEAREYAWHNGGRVRPDNDYRMFDKDEWAKEYAQ